MTTELTEFERLAVYQAIPRYRDLIDTIEAGLEEGDLGKIATAAAIMTTGITKLQDGMLAKLGVWSEDEEVALYADNNHKMPASNTFMGGVA